jgi:hypothetical protein
MQQSRQAVGKGLSCLELIRAAHMQCSEWPAEPSLLNFTFDADQAKCTLPIVPLVKYLLPCCPSLFQIHFTKLRNC